MLSIRIVTVGLIETLLELDDRPDRQRQILLNHTVSPTFTHILNKQCAAVVHIIQPNTGSFQQYISPLMGLAVSSKRSIKRDRLGIYRVIIGNHSTDVPLTDQKRSEVNGVNAENMTFHFIESKERRGSPFSVDIRFESWWWVSSFLPQTQS